MDAKTLMGKTPGTQILTLNGLRFDASLGILDHEKSAPQPIRVDAELNLGPQPLLPRDDDITHVLDYRKVRQIIIDECTAEHVNLLETPDRQAGAPAPDAAARRVRACACKIAKLEIFDDCEVAIRMEAGQW
jgi:dihydroneopterin aldolase